MNKTIGMLMLGLGFIVGISISVAYAVVADDLICDKCVNKPDMARDSVGSGKIINNVVKSVDIKDNSIKGIDIADHTVGSVDMAISWISNTMGGLSTGQFNVEAGVTCPSLSDRAISGEIYPNNVFTEIDLKHSGDDDPRTWTFVFDVKGDSIGNQEVKWRVACLRF